MNTTNFTDGQINWASQHDWFKAGNSQSITCYEDYTEAGLFKTKLVSFTNFQNLRDWAGY